MIDTAEDYITSNPVCPKHTENIRSRISRFAAWHGGISLAEMTPEAVNRFLLWLEAQHLSPETINGYRSTIMAVWRFGRDGERITAKIRRANTPRKIVESWDMAEVERLIAVASKQPGTLPNGLPVKLFWLTAIHAGYCTGQRYGDLLTLEVDSIKSDRSCQIVQSKTGKIVTVRFSKKAMLLIRSHRKEVVLPNPHTQKWFCHRFRRLVLQAGVRTGTYRWLRRTCGSYVDAATGRGHELLGNTRAVFERNYRVATICGAKPLEPPRL